MMTSNYETIESEIILLSVTNKSIRFNQNDEFFNDGFDDQDNNLEDDYDDLDEDESFEDLDDDSDEDEDVEDDYLDDDEEFDYDDGLDYDDFDE